MEAEQHADFPSAQSKAGRTWREIEARNRRRLWGTVAAMASGLIGVFLEGMPLGSRILIGTMLCLGILNAFECHELRRRLDAVDAQMKEDRSAG